MPDPVLKPRRKKIPDKVLCWEFFHCNKTACPVYLTGNLKCWLISETLCRERTQGKFLEKIELCLGCRVFHMNMDVPSMKETIKVVSRQFRHFRRMVEERDKELENMSLEMALGLSEVFEALKKISSGDPSVRMHDNSGIELISKLKRMVNMTAGEIGEIVDLSHEFAIGLAEHFEVLHRVSRGDLETRVSGGSKVELLESLKEVTNETIENISREIGKRVRAEKSLQQEKGIIDSAINSMPCIFCLMDGILRLVRWNRNFESVTGYSAEEMRKMQPVDFVDKDDKKEVEEKLREVAVKGQTTAEIYLLAKDGVRIPYMLTFLRFSSGAMNYFVMIGIDITDKKLTENMLREKEGRESLILSSLPIAFYTMQPPAFFGTIWVSAQIDRITGFLPEAFVKDPLLRLSRIHPDDRERVIKKFQSIGDEGNVIIEYRWQCADGSYNWFCDQAGLILDDKGRPREIVGALVDITERKHTEEALRILSLADELTHLYNRRGFFTFADQQLKIANRMKKKILLLFADLDDLKWINDNFGHHEGDHALTEFAGILRKTFRESDFIARIGGDEFVVLAVETEDANAETLTARLVDSLRTYNQNRTHDYPLSVSIGVSRYDPEAPCSIKELLAKADRLMYKQKKEKANFAGTD
ncbi:MAG: diguanylate cyclase [Nitrospirota bacterium]